MLTDHFHKLRYYMGIAFGWCVLALFFAGPVLSQQPTWTTIHPIELGLHSNAITALFQDQDANLWIGTAGGDVAVLEGGNWKAVFKPGEYDGSISKITSDKKGTIWVINGGNIWRYGARKWTRYGGTVGSGIGKVATRVSGSDCWDRNIVGAEPEIFDGVPFISGDVADLEFDEENTLWVVSESEKMIFSFDEEHISCWDEFSTKLVFYHNPVQVLPLSQGRVLTFEAVYPNPFWLYDRGQWSLLPEDQFSLSAKLVVNSSGVVFGGATDGIYRLSSEKWENIVAWNFDEYESCYSIVFDDSDGMRISVKMTTCFG